MKKAIWTLSAMALIGFGMAACDEDDVNNALDNLTDSWNYCSETLPDPNVPGEFAKYKVEDEVTKEHACSAYQKCAEGLIFQKDKNAHTASCVNDERNWECKVPADCEDNNETCDTATHTCASINEVEDQYIYVRIDDGSEDKYTGEWDATKGCAKVRGGGCENDPGADIDAVVLTKKNGDIAYAGDIYDYQFGVAAADIKYNKANKDEFLNGPKLATNPLNILGNPKSLVDYGTENAKCNLYIDDPAENDCFGNADVQCNVRPYVSLGGPGGYIVVVMDDKIEVGDTLDILEVGDCTCTQTNDATGCGKNKAVADAVKVYISITESSTDDYKILLDTATAPQHGVISIPITETMFTQDKNF